MEDRAFQTGRERQRQTETERERQERETAQLAGAWQGVALTKCLFLPSAPRDQEEDGLECPLTSPGSPRRWLW